MNSDAELIPGTLNALVAALDDGADLVDPVILLVAWRQGWAREKARGWVWLARHLPYLRARRRRVAAARIVGDDVLGALLTTTFDAAQLPLPAAVRPFEVLLQGWWRFGSKLLRRRAVRA